MDRKLRSPPKHLPSSSSKDLQSKNTSPNDNIASKYKLRNLYVSLQRLPSSDVEKWKNCDHQFSKTSIEISPNTKNDNQTMVRSRKSNNSNTKEVSDGSKFDNITGNSATDETKQPTSLTSSEMFTKNSSHPTEQDDISFSITRRSSLRNASTSSVTKDLLPTSSNSNKSELIKDNSDEKMSLLSQESNQKESHVRHLRSKTINKSDESNLPSAKKLKTSNNESIPSPSSNSIDSSNKLKRNLDEEESNLEQKAVLKKAKKINESEVSFEKVEKFCSSPESSNPNSFKEFKPSRRLKSKPTKCVSGTAPNILNKSNNDQQKEKKKISKEPEEEPRSLRSSTIKQTLSYPNKLEDKNSTTDGCESPKSPSFTIITSDDKNKSRRSSDADLVEPRVLRSSSVKQVPLPAKDKIDVGDINKKCDSSFQDSPESSPLADQLDNSVPTPETKVVLLKETSSKKLPVEPNVIVDPRKTDRIAKNLTTEKDFQKSIKDKISEEIVEKMTENSPKVASPPTKTNLNPIPVSPKNKTESIFDSLISKSQNKTPPFKKEISLFETSMASRSIKTYSRKGKRKYRSTDQLEIKEQSLVETENSVDPKTTSQGSVQSDKSSTNTLNPLDDTDLDKIKDKSDGCFKGPVDTSPSVSAQDINVPLVQKKEPEIENIIYSKSPEKSPKSSDFTLSIDKFKTRRKHSIAKSSWKRKNSTTDLSTFIQISKMYSLLSKMTSSGNFKDVLSDVDTSHKKLSSSTTIESASSSPSGSKVAELNKINAEKGNSPQNSKNIVTTDTSAPTKPKKIRKESINKPCNDSKNNSSSLAITPTKREITLSVKNKTKDSEKSAEKKKRKEENYVAEDFVDSNKLNISETKNITFQSHLPVVESPKTSPSKNLAKSKEFKKKIKSPTKKLSCPDELKNIDKNLIHGGSSIDGSHDTSQSQFTPSAASDLINSKDTVKDQLLKIDPESWKKDSTLSGPNTIFDKPLAQAAGGNQNSIEKVDLKKDSSMEAKVSTTEERLSGLQPLETVKDLKTEKDDLKKDFSVPDQKLSTPKQLSKRAAKKRTRSNESKECSSILKSPAIINESLKETSDSKKEVPVLDKQLTASRQVLKRAVKKENISYAPGGTAKSPVSQTTSNEEIKQNVGKKDTKTFPQKQKLKSSETVLIEENPKNIVSEISQLSPFQIDKQDSNKGKIMEDTSFKSEKLSSPDQIILEKTPLNISTETLPSRDDSKGTIKKKASEKKRISLRSSKLSSSQSVIKEKHPLNTSGEVSLFSPSKSAADDLSKVEDDPKKDTSVESKKLPPKKIVKKESSLKTSKQSCANAASDDSVKETVDLKKDNSLNSKKFTPPEIVLKEEVISSEIAKSTPTKSGGKDSPNKNTSKTLSPCKIVVKEESFSNTLKETSKISPSQAANNASVRGKDSKKTSSHTKKSSSPRQVMVKKENSKSLSTQSASNDPKKDASLISKISPNKILVEEFPLNTSNEISKISPSQASGSHPDKGKIDSKKPVPLKCKKSSSSPKQVIIREETPLSVSEISSEISKSPSQAISNDEVADEVDSKEDIFMISSTPPIRIIEIEESPPNELIEPCKTPIKADNKALIKRKSNLRKKRPLKSSKLSAMEIEIKEKSSISDLTTIKNDPKKDTSLPLQTKNLPQTLSSKNNEIKVEEPTNSSVEVTNPSPTHSEDLIEDKNDSSTKVLKEEPPKNTPPTPEASNNLVQGKIHPKIGTSLKSKKLSRRKIVKEEQPVNTSNASQLPPIQAASNDSVEGKVDSKKDTSLQSKKLSPTKILKEKLPKNTSNGCSKLPATQATNAAKNLAVGKVSPKKGTDILPLTQSSKTTEIIIKEDISSSTGSEISKIPQNEAVSKDLIKQRPLVQKDSSLPAEKLSPSKQIGSIEKTLSTTSTEISKTPSRQSSSVGVVESRKLPESPLSVNKEIIVKEGTSLNTVSNISELPPQSAVKDVIERKTDAEKGTISASDKLLSPKRIGEIEKPSNSSKDVSKSSPLPTTSSDEMEVDIESKKDTSSPSKTLSQNQFLEDNKMDVEREIRSKNTSGISKLSSTESVDNDSLQNRIESVKNTSLASKKLCSKQIVVAEKTISSRSNEVSKSPLTQAVSNVLIKESVISKEDTSDKLLLPEKTLVTKESSSKNSSELSDAAFNSLIKENIDSKKESNIPLPSKRDDLIKSMPHSNKDASSTSQLTKNDGNSSMEKRSSMTSVNSSSSVLCQTSCNNSSKDTILKTGNQLPKIDVNSIRQQKPAINSNKSSPSLQDSSKTSIKHQTDSKKGTPVPFSKLMSLSEKSKTIKKDGSGANTLNKSSNLQSRQMSRDDLIKNIIALTRDTSVGSKNLSHSQLSRMYRSALFKQISKYTFSTDTKISISVHTQTENNIDDNSLKSGRFKKYPTSLLSSKSLSTNNSSNVNVLKKANVPNSSSISRSSNGHSLNKKLNLNLDKNSSPLSKNLLSKNQVPKIHKPIRKEEPKSRTSSVSCIRSRRSNVISPECMLPYICPTNEMIMKITNKPKVPDDQKSKESIEICKSCRQNTIINSIKHFYSSNRVPPRSASPSLRPKSNPNNIGLYALIQAIKDAVNSVEKGETSVIIELVPRSFYESVLAASKYNMNQTGNSNVKTGQINPDPVFKVPTKAPPRAKNKKNTISDTFLIPKAEELEVGVLVRTCFGIGIRTDKGVTVIREIPPDLRFNLSPGNDKLYFRRRVISNQSDVNEDINKPTLDDFEKLELTNYERACLFGENNASGCDEEEMLVINKNMPDYDKLFLKDFQTYREAEKEIIRMCEKRGHISPLTYDTILTHLVNYQHLKSLKGIAKVTNYTGIEPVEIVVKKKKKPDNAKLTAEDILRNSGHEAYCLKVPAPPYYELMKTGEPFQIPAEMLHKNYSISSRKSSNDLKNTNDNKTNLTKEPENKVDNLDTKSIEPYTSKESGTEIRPEVKPNLNNHLNGLFNEHLDSERTLKNKENSLLQQVSSDNLANEVNSNRDAKALESESDRELKQHKIATKGSKDHSSSSEENKTVTDENSHSPVEHTIRKSIENNQYESFFKLEEYMSELKALDQSIINAGKNYKKSIDVEQVNKDLRLMVPKDGYRKELPERPAEWFLKFVTKFKKLELWRLHHLFKLHDHLMRVESAKINALEKMYEKLSGNQVLNDEREN